MRIVFFVYLMVLGLTALAANRNLTGSVRAELSGEPIPYANIFFMGTSIGTQSNEKGHFEIKNAPNLDTLTISALGFITQSIDISKISKRNIEIVLSEENYTLNEIVVLPTENPAFAIIRNVIKQRDRNNPENLPKYNCQTYTKLAVYVDKAPKNDTIALHKTLKREIKREKMPIFFSEKLANNSVNKETGQETMELISSEQRGLGIISDIQIDGYSTAMSTEVNFYQNNIELFSKNFPNPIGDNAFTYYRYRLIDSTVVDNKTLYTIDFKPKHKKDLAFKGTMVISNDLWNISTIETELPKEANINFLNSFEVEYNYQRINDTTTFFKSNEVRAKLYYRKLENTNKAATLTINKSTIYSNISIIGDSTIAMQPAVGAEMKELRPVALSPEELKMHQSIDSLNHLHWMKVLDKLTTAAVTGYFPWKKLDFGPYVEYIKHNRVEGLRLTLGARTGESFNPNYSVSGKVGYGFRDEGWKYGAGFIYKPKLNRRTLIGVEFDRDMIIIGSNGNMRFINENTLSPEEDNILMALASRRPNDRLSLRDKYSFWGEHELKRGLVVRLRVEEQQIQTGIYIPFTQNGVPVPEISTNAVSIEGRFAIKEKTADKFLRRYHLGSRYPIINTAITAGHYNVLAQNDYFFKFHATLKHNFFWGVGKMVYVLEGGYIMGKVPFPLLEIPRANETHGLARFRYNTINNMQLAADKYASVFAEYHLNGMIVNRLPVIRAFNLREVISTKILFGGLSNRHQEIMNYPVQLSGISQPLIEIGGGFENIFRFFRLEAIYRISSQKLEHAPPFAIKARFQIEL